MKLLYFMKITLNFFFSLWEMIVNLCRFFSFIKNQLNCFVAFITMIWIAFCNKIMMLFWRKKVEHKNDIKIANVDYYFFFANWNYIKFYEHCFSNCEHWKFKWNKVIQLFQLFFYAICRIAHRLNFLNFSIKSMSDEKVLFLLLFVKLWR